VLCPQGSTGRNNAHPVGELERIIRDHQGNMICPQGGFDLCLPLVYLNPQGFTGIRNGMQAISLATVVIPNGKNSFCCSETYRMRERRYKLLRRWRRVYNNSERR
jgi:hypothetical protein